MSDAKQESVETVYGTVDVETVDCDSCGEAMLKEDANPFTIGDRDGYACDYCVREGPIGFPERVREYALPTDENGYFWIYMIFGPIFLPGIILDAFSPVENDFDTGYFIGVSTIILWVGIPLLLIYVFLL